MPKKVLLILLILYLLFRLPNLTNQPIFADEAIYIHWAQIISEDKDQIFIPLSDGKTPLFMWLLIPILNLFSDPLFAGRFLSIMSGIATLFASYLLGKNFFNKKVALWSAFLITITPYIAFFDRMALVDSMFSAFFLWSLYFSLIVSKDPNIKNALILGVILAGGILTKTPGIIAFYLLPISLITLPLTKWFKSATYLFISILVGLGIYNLLRISPYFSNLSQRDKDYIFPISRIFTHPFDPLTLHLKDISAWLPSMLTWPILLLLISAIIFSLIKVKRIKLVLILWSLIPLLILASFLQIFTTRYILFTIPPLLILTAFLLNHLANNILKTTIFIIILIFSSLTFNFPMLFDMEKTPLPRESKRGYFEDWTAGYNLKEIAQNLDQNKDKTVVWTQETFGTLPDGLIIYLDNPKVLVLSGGSNISDLVYSYAESYPTYLVINKSRLYDIKNLTLVKEYPKLKGPEIPQDSILLFKVNPE